MVGRPITMETSTSPATRPGRIQPTVEIHGLAAMRIGYLTSSRVSGTPLARAVVTYGMRSWSSTLARMVRRPPPIDSNPSTTSGIQMCARKSRNLGTPHGASTMSGENRPPGW